VLLRTREELGGKLTQAEQRARDAEARLAEIDRQQREANAQIPDVFEDPQANQRYWANRIRTVEQQFSRTLDESLTAERLANSEDKWSDKLGEEKFGRLIGWVKTWPKETHLHAMKQRDPYGWAWKQFEQIDTATRAKPIMERLGDRDLDAYIEEQVAARIANAQAQPAEEPIPGQPRASNGQFASTSTQQRHQPPSLATVNGAPAPRGAESRSGFDALMASKRG